MSFSYVIFGSKVLQHRSFEKSVKGNGQCIQEGDSTEKAYAIYGPYFPLYIKIERARSENLLIEISSNNKPNKSCYLYTTTVE